MTHRHGFSLLELMVVTAIIVFLAALGIGATQELIPRFRTRGAAQDFAQTVNYARQLAMTESVETRILLESFDSSFLNPTVPGAGAYRLQVGNRNTGSTCWDTLPTESGAGCVDSLTSEGAVDIGEGGQEYAKGVSIQNWGTISGPDGLLDSIVFSPKGWVINPTGDFSNLAGGVNQGNIGVVFVNKASIRDATVAESWTVRIYRGGMVRIETNRGEEYDEDDAGTPLYSTP